MPQPAPVSLLCRCSRAAAPASTLCHTCGNTILAHLRQIEHCGYALSAVPTQTGDDSRHAPGFGSASPARDEVIVETDPRSSIDQHGHVGALAALASWTRLVSLERDTQQPAGISITGETSYLRTHHPWIVQQPWAADYALELADIRRRLVHLLGLAPDPPAGDCMRINCTGQVYPLPDASGVRCRACLTTYTGLDLARLHVAHEVTMKQLTEASCSGRSGDE